MLEPDKSKLPHQAVIEIKATLHQEIIGGQVHPEVLEKVVRLILVKGKNKNDCVRKMHKLLEGIKNVD